jgi:hypothetical protein
MQPVKRIEVIVPDIVLRDVLGLLERHQVAGYTVTGGLAGKGDRGNFAPEGLAGEFTNTGILIVVPLTGNETLLEDLRKVLAKFGGLCLVSDAQWLKH